METNNSTDENFPCRGSTLGRIGCILGYAGSTRDVALNYLVFSINLTYCVTATVLSVHYRKQETAQKIFATSALVFVVMFQLILCLMLGCTGISIIWCAMGGWIISEQRQAVESDNASSNSSTASVTLKLRMIHWRKMVILIDSAAIVYYGIIAEPITTIAHVCALVLGAVLSLVSVQLFDISTSSVVGSSSEALISTSASGPTNTLH